MRVGIETTLSAVTHASASVTATYKIYTQNQYTYNDNQSLDYSGAWSFDGSTAYLNDEGGTATLRATKSCTYVYDISEYGSSPGNLTFTATVSGAYNGVTPGKSITWTIPARPYDVPAPPTNLTATRASDDQADLAWTQNDDYGEPYDTQSVRYQRIDYDSEMSESTSIPGVAVVISIVIDAGFRWRLEVRANNSIGSSSWASQTNEDILTTPDAPSYLNTTNNPGTGITLTWDNPIHYSTDCFNWRIQLSVGGGAFSTVVEGLPGTLLTWTDGSPPSGTKVYRIQAYTTLSAGAGGWGPADLLSAWTTASTIGAPIAPLAPTGLLPNGTVADADSDIVLTWIHNHDGDYASQTKYQYRYSSDGGANWTTSADTASTDSTTTIAGGTLTNGLPYIWQVRTTGDSSTGQGPYSSSATLTTSSTPTVTLTAPGATTTDPAITTTWTYNQDESSIQTQWQARLYLGATLLESRSGTTEVTSTFAISVLVGSTYAVQVRALSAAGLWSAWASVDTTMTLLPPADVTLTCSNYDDVNGTWSITVTGDAPVGGVTETIDEVSVERQVDGAGEWLPVAEPMTPDGTVIDPLPSTSGSNSYRAVVTGVNGSHLITTPITCSPQDCDWVRINFGSRLATAVRCNGAPDVGAETARLRAAVHYLGRTWPSLLVGDQYSQTINFKGTLHFDPDCDDCTPQAGATSTAAEWEAMSLEADAVMYRDHAGRRALGALGGVQISVTHPGVAELAFTLTVIDATLERTLTGFPDLGED